MEELERIPLIKKIAAPTDCMDLEEVEHKIHQYLQLWILYAEIPVELKKKIRTVKRKHSDSMQSVQTIHLRHTMTG